MVPSEGSPGSSLDLSSDSDVSPNAPNAHGASQPAPGDGKVSIAYFSTTDNSRQENGFMSSSKMSPVEHTNGSQMQGILVDSAISQNGTLKRKREGSEGGHSPVSRSSTATGNSPWMDGNVGREKSQKLGQGTPDQTKNASLSSGSRSGKEPKPATHQSIPTKTAGPPQLSPELWQHIFSFVPPVFLGRLLSVNRAFNKILNPGDCREAPTSTTGALPYRSADFIWNASMQQFGRGIPKSLPGLNHLQMWRLLRGKNCQICGVKKPLSTTHTSPDPWHAGPGSDNLRVFWAFGIRLCSQCMRNTTEKEVTVLYSSTFPAFLMPALTCAFISQSDHLVASNELRTRSPPSDIILTKVFYKPQMEEMKTRIKRVILDHGPAAVDEWIKGLDDEGRERADEIIRWENWEARGGLEKVNVSPSKRKPAPSKKQIPKVATPAANAAPKWTAPGVQSQPLRPLSLPEKPATPQNISPTKPPPGKSLTWRPVEPQPVPVPEHLPQRPQVPPLHNRFERSIHDVMEAKAARRAEIERRCMLLDPPLKPNVLQHMDAFQAAVQITSYLTETAWEVLKPRLLIQREAAESRENERIHQEMILQVQTEELRQQEEYEKDSKDNFEKEWEAAQAPIRLRLGAYADQMIKQTWAEGASITKENCPKFAVDVLLWARERFFDDQQKQDETLRAAGGEVIPDEPDAPPTRRLILENMKWLYENKIRPFTDEFQRDLFLCSSCDGKFYGFEGVIQHYAAKHTSSMSLGNVVVHWRADWPDQPPFNSNPLSAVASQEAASAPLPGAQSQPNGFDQSLYGMQGQNSVSAAQNTLSAYPASQYPPTAYPMQYQALPSQSLYHSQQGPQYQGQAASGQGQASMYPLGAPYQVSAPPITAYVGTYPYTAGQNYPLPGYAAPNGQAMYSNSSQPTTMATGYTPYTSADGSQYPAVSLSSIPGQQSNATPENAASAPTQAADLYNKQMDEMAVHAREVWFTTSGIKDMPHSVRIYVVIQQVSSRFAKKYTNEPSLSMFLDGLNNMAAMRPVRSVNGLTCATCAKMGGDSEASSDPQAQNASGMKRLFTLPLILNHFRTTHLEKAGQQPGQVRKPDWRYEMIQLPDAVTISNIVHAQGIDNKKLQLLSDVFPDLFPTQIPNASAPEQYYPVLNPDDGQEGAFSVLQKIKANQAAQSTITYGGLPEVHTYDTRYNENLPDSRTYSPATARASEPPGEDEYDPHRPAFLGRMVTPFSAGAMTRKVTGLDNGTATKPSAAYAPAPSPTQSSSYTYPAPTDQAYLRAGNIHDSNNYPLYSAATPTHGPNTNSSSNVNGGSQRPNQGSSISVQTPPDVQPPEHIKYPANGSLNQSGINSEHQTPSSKTFVGSEADRFLKDFEANNSIRRPAAAPTNERFGTPTSREDDRLYARRRSPPMEHPEQIAYEMSQRGRPSLPHQTVVYQEPWSRQSSQPRGTPIPISYPAPDGRYYASREQGLVGEMRRAYESDPRTQYPQYDVQHVNATRHGSNERAVQPPMPRYYGAEQPLPIQYRERSRSPRVVALPPGHYRQRSPIEATRQEYYYPVPVAARAESRERQPVYYNYQPTQEEYTYVRGRQASEAPQPRRVEYIPVREDEYASAQQGRYVIAQPAPEVGGGGEHVRYVRYPQEQVYEQPGASTYYANQAAYEPRQARTVYQPMEGVGVPMQRPRY